MSRQDMRSPLARALALGSAKSGVAHWWAQRASALALVPLSVWFAASIIAHTGSDHAGFVAWLRTPVAGSLMAVLLLSLFHHAALGLQVVIEDYMHTRVRFAAILLMRFGCVLLAVTGIVATLRIAFGR